MSVLDADNLTAEQTVELNRLAREIRAEFNTLVALVSSPTHDDIDWFVASIASRNPGMSPLFSHCCILALVGRLCEQADPPSEIVVSNPLLGRVVRAFLRDRGLQIPVQSRRAWRRRGAVVARLAGQSIEAGTLLFARWWSRRTANEDDFATAQPIVLVDTFVLGGFQSNRPAIQQDDFSDRYYPGLDAALSPADRERVFYVPTLLGFTFWDYRKAVKRLRRASRKFLLVDDFLWSRDYLFAFLHPLRMLGARRSLNVDFRGFDVGPILRHELWATSWAYGSLCGLLNYRFARRLAATGVPVHKLIEWYENQPVDRGMIAGFHRYLPEVPISGYQGYIASTETNLHLHPTSHEVAAGLVPDKIVVTGRGMVEATREFCAYLPVETGPAFRFQALLEAPRGCGSPNKGNILVPLPISLVESRRIVDVVAVAFADASSEEARTVNLLPHPAHSRRALDEWRKVARSGAMKVSRRGFDAMLAEADLVISSMSSSCVVALAYGVPVIVVGGRSGITENPIPAGVPEEMWRVCHTPTELRFASDRFLRPEASDQARRSALASEIRDQYFEPVTAAGVARFVWS